MVNVGGFVYLCAMFAAHSVLILLNIFGLWASDMQRYFVLCFRSRTQWACEKSSAAQLCSWSLKRHRCTVYLIVGCALLRLAN